MTAEFVKILVTDEKASVGQLLSALSWLNKDVTQLRNRQKWIEANALPETIESIKNQIDLEIQETEKVICLIELRIKNKCTN